MVYQDFPSFHFDNFYLREISPIEDAEAFLKYINNPAVAAFLADADRPNNINGAINELYYWSNLFKQKRSIYWAIAELKNDHIIGTVGFNQYNINHKKAELSYDLDYNFWGKGIMSRSLASLIEYAFNTMDVVRIQATMACHNQRSIKMLEELQFKREGMMAKFCMLGGNSFDYYMYSLIKN